MTIKQQGGIFGRNPTFNDLTVDTVDINGGNIDNTVIGSNTPAAISGTTGQFNTSLNVDGAITADGLTSSQKLEFNASEPAFISTGSTAKVYATNSSFDGINGSLVLQSRPVNGADVYIATGSTPKTVAKFFDGGNISFYDNTGTTAKLTWNAAAGNLAFASGNGIDFSATSGTGTSELFDDYEEGTWTAQLADNNTGTINYSPTTATGHYTKIGNIVHVSVSGWNNIDTTGMTSTNSLYMTLPFSGVTPHSVGSAVLNTFDFNTGSQVVIQSYYANALFYTNTDNATQATLRVNDITSGVSDIAALSLTYRV